MHARGTPTSGKSSLGTLFANYVNKGSKEHRKMACYLIAEELTGGETRPQWLQRKVLEQANGFFPKDQDTDSMEDLFIILDEGQKTYTDFDFWEILKNEKRFWGTHYLILCSWGSPTRYPNYNTVYSAPVILPPKQRVGFCHGRESISIFFTLEECRAAVQIWIQNPSMNPRSYRLDSVALTYLYSLTNGHPGATKGVFRLLLDV